MANSTPPSADETSHELPTDEGTSHDVLQLEPTHRAAAKTSRQIHIELHNQLIREHLEQDGPVPHGYHLAMTNRFFPFVYGPSGMDIQRYQPIFVHDVLMLPGSLTHLIDKRSASDIIPRMTPARLSKYEKVLSTITGAATLVPSIRPTAYAQGMLILGQGARQRAAVAQHYRNLGAATTVARVVIETLGAVEKGDAKKKSSERKLVETTLPCVVFVADDSHKAKLFEGPKIIWELKPFLEGEYLKYPKVPTAIPNGACG